MKWILIVPERAGKREPELGFLHGSLPSDLDFLPASEVLLSTKLGSLLVQTQVFSYVGFRSNGSVLRQLYFNFELANIWSFFQCSSCCRFVHLSLAS